MDDFGGKPTIFGNIHIVTINRPYHPAPPGMYETIETMG